MSLHNRFKALAVCCVLFFAAIGPGQQPPVVVKKTPEEVYRAVAPSAVAFLDGRRAMGSGVIVDVEGKLVLTAFHVVHDNVVLNRDIYVMFPEKKDDAIIADVNYYFGNNTNYSKKVKAEFVAGDLHSDLAVLRVPSLPAGAAAVPIGARPPQPAERIHVIGCSTGQHGGIFGYNQGFVRNNYLWAYGKNFYDALAHQSPTNHGDSGGPVANDRAELIGIVSQGTDGNNTSWWANQQVIDHSVSVLEIQEILAQVRTGKLAYQAPGGNSLTVTADASLSVDATTGNLHLRHADHDFFYVPALKGDKISVSVKGSGLSDLDLFADAGSGGYFIKEDGPTDQESGSHQPNYSGPFRIKVSNALTEAERQKIAERRKKGETIANAELQFTRQNRYTLSVSTTRPIAGHLYVNRSIPAQTSDDIQISLDAQKGPARIRLIGVGRCDLDLYVFAPSDKNKENAVHSSTGYLDRETLIFTPAETGVYTIRVKNLGETWNRYCLTTR